MSEDEKIDIEKDRKMAVNKWIVKSRWFYLVFILLISFLGNSIGVTGIATKYFLILGAVLFIINFLSFLTCRKVSKKISSKNVNYVGMGQIFIEFFAMSFAVYVTGGLSSPFLIFFLIPVIFSSFLFGKKGTIISSIMTVVFILIVVNGEGVIFPILPATDLPLSLKIVSYFVLFLILGSFSDFLIKLISVQEEELEEKTVALSKESEYRKSEWSQLDKTTKLLVKRDLELTKMNKELEVKMKDLRRSEKSMLKVFSDLKKQKRRTDAERNKVMAILSNFIDPIIVLDKNNKIELFNPSASDFFGLTISNLGVEIPNKNNFSMENFRKIINQDFEVKNVEDLKSGNYVEEVVISIKEQEFTFKVITAPVLDKNKESIGNMKIFYDLTREKMLDKLKSEFISIAAHQLRTPLAAIKWAIQMVVSGELGDLNAEQEKMLSRGYTSNQRIIELVNDMLNVSRIEEGRFGYSFEKGDIAKELQVVVDTLEQRLDAKKIKLLITKPDNLPEVFMDPKKIVLVLQNLVENAVKYTQDMGKIEINIEAGDKIVKIHVKDNGVGIPKEDQVKLFSKFFRATNVIRMQTEGSGLGLFMVRNIILKHGGDITFKSEEGFGTEFIFTLPIDQKPQE